MIRFKLKRGNRDVITGQVYQPKVLYFIAKTYELKLIRYGGGIVSTGRNTPHTSNMAGQQNESSDLMLNLPDNNALYCDKSSDNNEYDVSPIKTVLS